MNPHRIGNYSVFEKAFGQRHLNVTNYSRAAGKRNKTYGNNPKRQSAVEFC
jgi:hypothetical protein